MCPTAPRNWSPRNTGLLKPERAATGAGGRVSEGSPTPWSRRRRARHATLSSSKRAECTSRVREQLVAVHTVRARGATEVGLNINSAALGRRTTQHLKTT